MSKNCPYCPPDSPYEAWGMGPQGMQQMKERHDKEHTVKCKECGQPIAIKSSLV